MRRLEKIAGVSAICAFLVACGGGDKAVDSCGGVTPQPVRYSVNHYDAALVRYPKAIDDQFYLSAPTAITGNQPVEWNAFSIEINAKWQVYSGFRWPTVSLFEQAIACSPAEYAIQKLTKISITSARDFNNKYPAGSELLPLFASIERPGIGLSAQLVNFTAPLDLKLKLLEAPTFAPQKFEVQITLDDGRNYILQTGDVYFNLP